MPITSYHWFFTDTCCNSLARFYSKRSSNDFLLSFSHVADHRVLDDQWKWSHCAVPARPYRRVRWRPSRFFFEAVNEISQSWFIGCQLRGMYLADMREWWNWPSVVSCIVPDDLDRSYPKWFSFIQIRGYELAEYLPYIHSVNAIKTHWLVQSTYNFPEIVHL
jgi:hypothetical protein